MSSYFLHAIYAMHQHFSGNKKRDRILSVDLVTIFHDDRHCLCALSGYIFCGISLYLVVTYVEYL